MSAEVRIPALLQKLVGDSKRVQMEGVTVKQLLDNLGNRYLGFRKQIMTEEGELRLFVNIYVNDDDISFLKELETPVKDGDVVSILIAVPGG